MLFLNLVIISILLTATYANDDDSCESVKDSSIGFNGFIHPLIAQIDKWDVERIHKFDSEDFDGYMHPVIEGAGPEKEFSYKVHVHGNLVFSADGYEDYHQKLKGILDSYIERQVDRFHDLPNTANYTLHHDGTISISRDVTVFERTKSEPQGQKVFQCSGFYQSLWIPLKSGSFKIEDWRIRSQHVFLLKMIGDEVK